MQDRGPGFRKTMEIDIAGGMNTREDPYFLRGKAFSVLRNYRRGSGGLRGRKGWTKLNATACSAVGHFLGGFAYKKRDGTVVELVVGDNNKVYRLSGGTLSEVTMYDTFTWSSTARPAFAQWRDDCYITCGAMGGCGLNMRYDGAANAIFSAGMAAPVGLSVASGGAGSVTEYRYYRCIYVDAVKGYPSAASASVEIDLTAEKATVTVPTRSGTGRTIHREVHVSNDDATWKLLALLEDNTTTTVTDDNADLATLGNISAGRTISLDTIPANRYVVSTQGGILLWGYDETNLQPSWVWRSASSDEPEVPDDTNLAVGDMGEPVNALRLFSDGAWVGKLGSQHLVPLDVTRSHCAVPSIGVLSHAGSVNVEGGIVFASQQGIRFFNGQSSPFVGRDLEGGSGSRAFELQRAWDSLDKEGFADIFAVDFGEGGSQDKGVAFFCKTDATKQYSQKVIWWDYRRNECHVEDWFCCAAWIAPVADSQEKQVHGAFPYGFIGRLDYGAGDGAGADGSAEMVHGGVTAATSTTLLSDKTDLTTAGSGHRGVHLHIYDGTGETQYRYVASNDGSTFYLDAGGSNDNGSFTTIPDLTSKWELGYRVLETDLPGIGVGDPGVAFQAYELQVHLGPPSGNEDD